MQGLAYDLSTVDMRRVRHWRLRDTFPYRPKGLRGLPPAEGRRCDKSVFLRPCRRDADVREVVAAHLEAFNLALRLFERIRVLDLSCCFNLRASQVCQARFQPLPIAGAMRSAGPGAGPSAVVSQVLFTITHAERRRRRQV